MDIFLHLGKHIDAVFCFIHLFFIQLMQIVNPRQCVDYIAHIIVHSRGDVLSMQSFIELYSI